MHIAAMPAIKLPIRHRRGVVPQYVVEANTALYEAIWTRLQWAATVLWRRVGIARIGRVSEPPGHRAGLTQAHPHVDRRRRSCMYNRDLSCVRCGCLFVVACPSIYATAQFIETRHGYARVVDYSFNTEFVFFFAARAGGTGTLKCPSGSGLPGAPSGGARAPLDPAAFSCTVLPRSLLGSLRLWVGRGCRRHCLVCHACNRMQFPLYGLPHDACDLGVAI